MSKTIGVFAALLFSLTTTGPTVAVSASMRTQLSAAQLHALLDDGVLLDFTFADGTTVGSIALLRNGPAFTLWRSTGGAGGADEGKWRIESDRVCFLWKLLRMGQEYCVRYYRVGENRYEVRDVKEDELLNIMSLRR